MTPGGIRIESMVDSLLAEPVRHDPGVRRVSPILLHIPHSSLHIPEDAKADFVIGAEELERELLKLTDRFTDELFELPGAERLVFGVSRLVVDPERFSEDAREPMSARGMGAVYMKTTSGESLRTGANRELLLAQYYTPHHTQLDAWAERAIGEHGRCLVIDCHSYPSRPLPCDQDQTVPRPLFCVGTDPVHTPAFLVSLTLSHLNDLAQALGAEEKDGVLVDRPYAGTMVPSRFYGHDSRVESIMIEINRELYMDESTGEKRAGFGALQQSMRNLLGSLGRAWQAHGEGR